jgi:hypothetical protein
MQSTGEGLLPIVLALNPHLSSAGLREDDPDFDRIRRDQSLGVGATSLGRGTRRANRERWTRHSTFLPIAASHHPVNLPFRNAAVGKGRHSTALDGRIASRGPNVLTRNHVSTASSRKKCPDRGGFFALRHSYL